MKQYRTVAWQRSCPVSWTLPTASDSYRPCHEYRASTTASTPSLPVDTNTYFRLLERATYDINHNLLKKQTRSMGQSQKLGLPAPQVGLKRQFR